MIGTNAAAVAEEIEQALAAIGTPERAAAEKRYLKSALECIGVPVPRVRAAVKAALRKHGPLDRRGTLDLVEALWDRPLHELRAAAVMVLGGATALLQPADIVLVERLLRESKTWALVDGLAGEVTGRMVEAHPLLSDTLDRWAAEDDFWLRRSALLALLGPLRRGGGDWERFCRYADAMLEEKEFFVRKAIGWVLREVSKKRPELVVDWLEPRLTRVSGVTCTEAVKYLPEGDRARLLAGYRKQRSARG